MRDTNEFAKRLSIKTKVIVEKMVMKKVEGRKKTRGKERKAQ